MDKVITRATQFGFLGSRVGKAVGTLISAGTTVASVASGPAGIVGKVAFTAATIVINSTTGEAIGALAGTGIGAGVGAVEEKREKSIK